MPNQSLGAHGVVMDGKRQDPNNAMWTRKAVLAYLNGEESLSWVLNVIEDGRNVDTAWYVLRDLHGYGDPERRRKLRHQLEARTA